MTALRTEVAIVGAGPAGLMLGHLLHRQGIDSIILEAKSREHVIERVRAGVLEQGTVDALRATGLAERLDREGLRHDGIYIAFQGARHHIDFASLTGGRHVTVYGQNELVKDLIDARVATGRPLFFDVPDVGLDGVNDAPSVRFTHDGQAHTITCDAIAGCDGFHGVSRTVIPGDALMTYERTYPFAWLGILAEAPPTSKELVYSHHDRGFALCSMRSPSVTRLYLQCAPEEDLNQWPDDRIWSELRTRLETDDGWHPAEGHITQKSVTGMRSFVVEPMRYGRLFLAGDAAHIVPPTGAKGLNLAMADVWRLADALNEWLRHGRPGGVDAYSAHALQRTWRAQRFSTWMTRLLHIDHDASPFDRRRQQAELEYLISSQAAMTSLAENYVGAPL